MHDLCMSTKTISLEVDAYEKLRRAKRTPTESFSSVVRRARWEETSPTGRQLLDELSALVSRHPETLLPAEALNRLSRRRRTGRRKSGWER
jgi:hypothetical protein